MTKTTTRRPAPTPRAVVIDDNLVTAIQLIQEGTPDETFNGVRVSGGQEYKFSASASLYVIREAWEKGADFEADADGFGVGLGTHNDWSAIRDSSDAARRVMLDKSLAFFGVDLRPALTCPECRRGVLELQEDGEVGRAYWVPEWPRAVVMKRERQPFLSCPCCEFCIEVDAQLVRTLKGGAR